MGEPESCLRVSVGEYTADPCAHVITAPSNCDDWIGLVRSLAVPIFWGRALRLIIMKRNKHFKYT